MMRLSAAIWFGLCPSGTPETVPSAPIVTICSGGSAIGVAPWPRTGKPSLVSRMPFGEIASAPLRVSPIVPSGAWTAIHPSPLTATSSLRPVAAIGQPLAVERQGLEDRTLRLECGGAAVGQIVRRQRGPRHARIEPGHGKVEELLGHGTEPWNRAPAGYWIVSSRCRFCCSTLMPWTLA